MGTETDHIPHHQSLGLRRVDGMHDRYWNIVCHTRVSGVPHSKKSEAYVDRPHCQSVVTGPDPHLYQVVSVGRNRSAGDNVND